MRTLLGLGPFLVTLIAIVAFVVLCFVTGFLFVALAWLAGVAIYIFEFFLPRKVSKKGT